MAICECCINVSNGNVRLSDSEYKRLSRHKNLIKEMANRDASPDDIRRLTQTGGFLPLLAALIPPVIGAVGTIVSSAVSRRRGG